MNSRNYYFDNVKLILISLVVFGHLIEPLIFNSSFRFIYMIIYSFHMPLFIFVTGYFAKPNLNGVNKLWKLFIKYEIIYGLCGIILFLIFKPELPMRESEPLIFTALQPIWLLWYLLSLIWWRYLLVLIKKYRYFWLILVFAIIAHNFLNFNFRVLSIGRTLSFAPFFFAGYYVKENGLNIVEYKKYRKILFILVIGLVWFWTYYGQAINEEVLYGAYSLSNINFEYQKIVEIKALMYIIAIYTGLIVLLFVTHDKRSYSEYGKDTLPIYIYHGLIIMVLKAVGFYELIQTLPFTIIITILFVFTMALVRYLPKLKV